MTTQNILVSSDRYDIAALVSNVAAVRRVVEFGAGAYEHSLSLPNEADIDDGHRTHRNNIPYADALISCPLFAEIFHTFRTAKASFRLLRRKAGTAYSLHDDRDMGDDIVRLQLPVVTNQNSLFLLQKVEPIARRIDEITRDDESLVFDYPRLIEAFGDWFDLFFLEPGYFNLINTNKVHSLVNGGEADRITLAIDLLRNDWLENWLSDHMTGEVQAQSTDNLPAGSWEWSALRHGLLSHPRVQLT
ncbi:MAG: hypothetical protein EP297_11090 [Gammaproteobacteria bacterium]|nr:MAG: hypothetical protein EP297_11090 [Gammaproteobacteria bacterium]